MEERELEPFSRSVELRWVAGRGRFDIKGGRNVNRPSPSLEIGRVGLVEKFGTAATRGAMLALAGNFRPGICSSLLAWSFYFLYMFSLN